MTELLFLIIEVVILWLLVTGYCMHSQMRDVRSPKQFILDLFKKKGKKRGKLR